jgi:hypothetical protein
MCRNTKQSELIEFPDFACVGGVVVSIAAFQISSKANLVL